MKKQKILITGGAGFIGTHLAERLCPDHEVILFDNLRRDSLRSLPGLKTHRHVRFVKGDVLDRRRIASTLKGCDAVLHLAAVAGVSSYYREPCETLRVNLIGTFNLLEACAGSKVRKVVDFSTSEVYGAEALNVDEESDHRIGPLSDLRWTYATSKLASEQLTHRYGEKYGFKPFSVRPFNVYGPRQTGEGAISNFLRAAAKGEPLVVYGNGAPVRAWCYVSDCVDAVMAILADNALPGGVFNVGNPQEAYTTLELANLVREVVGRRLRIVFKKVKRSEVRVRVPNIDRARKLLGYRPKVGLRTGLQLTYRWYADRRTAR